jgi:hypothetical protein
MTDLTTDFMMDAFMDTFTVVLGLMLVKVTVSDIEQRRIERQREYELLNTPVKEVAVWQTMF